MDRLCFSLKTGGRLAREDLRNVGGSWGPSWELRGMSCAWSRCLDTIGLTKNLARFVVCPSLVWSRELLRKNLNINRDSLSLLSLIRAVPGL